jgi:hypothetical protein
VFDDVLSKAIIIKKKQASLDGILTHLSKERTENIWIEKTISQFELNESQKENNNELSVFTQKQEEEQLIAPQSPDEFMWFDYCEIREKKLSIKEDLLHSF